MLFAHLLVYFGDHVLEIEDGVFVLHYDSVVFERHVVVAIDFVCKGTHVEDLGLDLATRVMNCLVDSIYCLLSLAEADADQG